MENIQETQSDRNPTQSVEGLTAIARTAGERILENYPGNENARASVERYVDLISRELQSDGPVNPDLVAGNDNLQPLQEAIVEINATRGYSEAATRNHFEGLQRLEQLKAQNSQVLADVLQYFGGWSGISGETLALFEKIQVGIDTGTPPELTPVEIEQLGISLPAALRQDIEGIYNSYGTLLTIPEVARRGIVPAEHVSRYLDGLSARGFDLDPTTAKPIGSGSEGTTYYVESPTGEPCALKIKHSADVSRTADAANVVAAVSSLALSFDLSTVAIRYEDREVTLMPFLASAPDLQSLHTHLQSGTQPEGEAMGIALAEFLDTYRQNTPEDTNFSTLTALVARAATELTRADQQLATSKEWGNYFHATENPITVRPVNFLVTGVSNQKLELTCIDAC